MIDIEWKSDDTENKALSEPYDFEIVELFFVNAVPLYDTDAGEYDDFNDEMDYEPNDEDDEY